MNKSHTPPRTTVLKELQGHWDDLGHRDPLWAILTSPSKKENQWDLDEFFHTGRYEITQALVKVSEFLPRFHSGRALDFGCGVGPSHPRPVPVLRGMLGHRYRPLHDRGGA